MGKIITLPFAALLRWIYAFTQSYGLSIIIFAVIVKVVLLPFQMKSKRNMIRMGRLSKKQQELQKQYAKNQQKFQEELQKLYQEEGVSPMGGCLWSFLPLFILMPLYSIIYRPVTHFMGFSDSEFEAVKELATSMGFQMESGRAAYEQIALTDFISTHWADFQGKMEGLINVDFTFLGLNLSATPTNAFSEFGFNWGCIGLILIPIIAALTQYLSSKIMMKSNGQDEAQQSQMRTMNIMMPAMSLFFCYTMPAAMGVYWIINSALMAVQDQIMGKFFIKKIEAEEAERAEKIEAARKLRQEEAKKRAAEQRENETHKPLKKIQPQKSSDRVPTTEAGRVGDRPYARGRSYQEDRYEK